MLQGMRALKDTRESQAGEGQWQMGSRGAQPRPAVVCGVGRAHGDSWIRCTQRPSDHQVETHSPALPAPPSPGSLALANLCPCGSRR